MSRLIPLVLLLALAGGCAPSFKREAEALQYGYLVLEAATEPVRDFDANGDGEPEDPAETRANVEALEREHRRLLREFVLVSGGDPDAVEAAVAARLGR